MFIIFFLFEILGKEKLDLAPFLLWSENSWHSFQAQFHQSLAFFFSALWTCILWTWLSGWCLHQPVFYQMQMEPGVHIYELILSSREFLCCCQSPNYRPIFCCLEWKLMRWGEPINRSELFMKLDFSILTFEHLPGLDCWKMTVFLSSGMKAILKPRC